MIRFLPAFVSFAIFLPLFSRGKDVYLSTAQEPFEAETPWLTGPLLTPSSRTTPKGHVNIQPYLLFTAAYGVYTNKWKIDTSTRSYSTNFETYINYGLTNWADLVVAGQYQKNIVHGKSFTGLGDSLFGFGFQLYEGMPDCSLPSMKFSIVESFPTGTYQDLDPTLFGTDGLGSGSFTTRFALTLGKLIHIKEEMWIQTRSSFGYWYFTPVNVRNNNVYGGSENTNGIVYKGGGFPISIGSELTLTKNFVIACDLVSQFYGKTTFKGNPGNNTSISDLESPLSYQLSIAPALEWNFSTQFGIIAGAWCSLCGKNSQAFASGVISINIYM